MTPLFSLEMIRSAGAESRVSAFAPMNAQKPRALDPVPSPLLFASSHRKNGIEKWEPGRGGKGRMCKDTIPCAFGATKSAEPKSVSRPMNIRALSGVCPVWRSGFVRGTSE